MDLPPDSELFKEFNSLLNNIENPNNPKERFAQFEII